VETLGTPGSRRGTFPAALKAHEQHRVVVGLDGSAGSRVALGWAVRQARRRESSVHAVLVWQHREFYPGNIGSLGLVPTYGRDQAADAVDEVRQIVMEVVKENQAGECRDVVVTSAAVKGLPATALLEASDGADMLVLGKRRHSGIRNALLGSLGQRLLAHALCPVVVVPNPDTDIAEEPTSSYR
jgi:nucleotide-binding universal stress UspA family protein